VRRSRGAGGAVDTPKTKRSRRTVPLSAAVRKAFAAHRESQLADRQRCEEVDIAYVDSDFVCTREDGEGISQDHLGQDFHRCQKRWGGQRINFHDMRHTFATSSLLAGGSAKVVSEMLGHATVAFTLQTYAHVLPTSGLTLRDAVGGVRVAIR
jgi:integrase